MGLGATSIGVGALYGTGAFSSVNAGRGVSVNAVGDSEGALLGIDNIDTSDDPVFTNNTSLDMVVTLEEVDTEITFDGEESPYTFPEDGVLEPGDSRGVEIQSEDDSEDALVDITTDLSKDGTKTGEITLRRDFAVPQSEIVDFTGEADTAGGSGQFEFDLRNTGDKDVTLTGVGINATTNDADEVSAPGNNASLEGGGQSLVTEPIPIDSSDPDDYTHREFDSSFVLSEDQTSNFDFNRFRSDGDGIDMRGQNVRITVSFGDDSSKEIDLCLDDESCGEY